MSFRELLAIGGVDLASIHRSIPCTKEIELKRDFEEGFFFINFGGEIGYGKKGKGRPTRKAQDHISTLR